MGQLSFTSGMLVCDTEALKVNEKAPIEAGGSRRCERCGQEGAALLLGGATRLNSSSARLIFATSSEPSAHIPLLLAEDTTHSRRANKNLTQLPGCARTEHSKKHCVFVRGDGQ